MYEQPTELVGCFAIGLRTQVALRLTQAAKSVRTDDDDDDDDVVDYVNAHQLTGFDQRAGHIDIFFAWSKRTSRMIVRNDDRMGVSQ